MLKHILRAYAARRDGSVSVIGAISLPVLIAMTGLVAEYGNGLLHKVENQRIADAAAFSAATVYNANPSNSMTSVVDAVATLNGIPTSAISESLVTSPSGDGNQAIEVNVTTQAPLLLSNVLGNTAANLTVTATSYAEMKGGAPGCIIALSGSGSGVTLSGGTAVTAQSCAVASDAAVSVPCGTTITTVAVDYNSSSAPSEPCTGIRAPTGGTLAIHKTATTDPIAGTTQLSSATGTLSTFSSLTYPGTPSTPTVAATNFAFGAPPTLPSGCTTSGSIGSGSTWTVTCTGTGPFNFGALSIHGGVTLNLNTGGSSSAVYNFNGSINDNGTAMHFGPGTYNIAGGVVTQGGSITTFAGGTFNIGSGAFSCNGSTGYSICNTGSSLTFGGPSTFNIQGGVYDSGGEILTLGSGSTNSFDIGKANDGDSFSQGGGATTTFADATGSGDVFQMQGNVDVASGGGSCLTLSAATNHYIDGYFASAGGTIMGAGVYTVDGYFALGPGGGGDVTCSGTSIGLLGNGVTMVIGGATNPTSGICTGLAFCMDAGYSNVKLIAPTSGPTANLAVVGPQSGTQGASLGEGASGANFSGAFYFPTAAISMSGGSSLGSFGSGQCLMLVGSQVSLSGGAALASSCSGLGGSGASTSVALVE